MAVAQTLFSVDQLGRRSPHCYFVYLYLSCVGAKNSTQSLLRDRLVM